MLAVCRGLALLLDGRELDAREAGAWAVERLPADHRALVITALGAAAEWDPEALRRFRTFAVGATVRRRPGRKVAGLP